MSFLPSLRAGSSLPDVFKAFPETSRPLIAFHEALLRGPSPFTPAERELIAAYVSGLNRCRYCHAVHTATAEILGVPQGTVQRLVDGMDAATVPEKMNPVLRYAEKLTRQPAGVSKTDAEAIVAAGWDETALYHAVAVTALFNFMNRLVEGLGIELVPAYAKPAGERLAGRGYLPLIEMYPIRRSTASSRASVLRRALPRTRLGGGPRQRIGGSLAAALWAASQGVQILRVHDVAETRQALALRAANRGGWRLGNELLFRMPARRSRLTGRRRKAARPTTPAGASRA